MFFYYMTQDEKWIARYNEVREYIESNHRNPLKHFEENRYDYTKYGGNLEGMDILCIFAEDI